ncbi:tetratricopeptide repeat protein 27 [Copidosoma floridanum]|uniref:tetratricopeptide repeat protein 27 n=1 Tax=Copidosoma floridanum TaxID=29053 RepID=UPI0006C9A350|nr:tetratricopeptide repeat protein 27 [Copidosoma floridanum]
MTSVFSKNFEENISEKINASSDVGEKWFCIGVASLLYFIQNNWTGPFANTDVECLLGLRNIAAAKLTLEDQYNENVVKPELLYLAKVIFHSETLRTKFPLCTWWLLRANLIHQLLLEESSAVLFAESEELIKTICESDLVKDSHLKAIFKLEVTHFYLYYTRIQSSEKYLEEAAVEAQLSFDLEGALGKRTKYQQQEKAQLYLKAKLEKEPFPHRGCDNLPKVINLSDDLRLEKIEFSEKREKARLGSIEESVILTKYFQLKVSQPKDELTNEVLAPYLDQVIDETESWALKMSALFQRCILESNHKRTIERSLSQVEYLIEQLKCEKTPIALRMDSFFASGMKPVWVLKQHLANLMLNLGMVKGALDLYLNLSLWEDVIVCYTILEMKHKAADVIRQELAKKPTVKLWCLLGDNTQEVEHYETAWKLSGEKSSRAQRHWGFYYYSKQNYKEAIPHLKLSLELNNIQENVWVRLGFAALQVEDWKLAASAYRKYCALEQSSFEVWNNLAKAYIKLGDKARAWRSLQDAIKCNFDKWEVWDNLMVVSTDLGHFSEVIRCYHRILDVKGVHVDIQVLTILSKAIIDELKDSDGNSSRKFLQKTLELFGRLTSMTATDSDIWRLYAELTLLKKDKIDNEKAARYLQRAYQAAVANPRWFTTIEDSNKVLETCKRLAEASLKSTEHCAVQQKRQILASAKLSLQSVVRKIKDLAWEDMSDIAENLSTVEEYLQKVLDELEKIKGLN